MFIIILLGLNYNGEPTTKGVYNTDSKELAEDMAQRWLDRHIDDGLGYIDAQILDLELATDVPSLQELIKEMDEDDAEYGAKPNWRKHSV